MAEEYVGGLGGSHGEVDEIRLQNRGVSCPAPGVADVVDGDLDGVSCRRCPFAEAMGSLAKTCWWAMISGSESQL